MKSNRKLLAIIIALVLCIAALVGCGGAQDPPPADDYGELCIEDVTVYVSSTKAVTFAEINPVFAVNVEQIQFTGTNASPYYDTSKYPVSERALKCEAVNDKTTLIIGDSFTDDYFIGEYMSTYSTDKEVLNAGISSTTSYHWEAAYKTIIGSTAPKNIVFHIGTNNFYDIQDDVEETVASLKRLMMFVHSDYPTSKIYWFNITQRTDTRYAEQVTETNSIMANWCAKYDFITCVDTCSKITTAMLKDDGVHPLTSSYKTFTDALTAAGCVIETK